MLIGVKFEINQLKEETLIIFKLDCFWLSSYLSIANLNCDKEKEIWMLIRRRNVSFNFYISLNSVPLWYDYAMLSFPLLIALLNKCDQQMPSSESK